MCEKYTRVTMLLPDKPKNHSYIESIRRRLSTDFGGDTHRSVIVLVPADGDWFDPQTGKFIQDHHISISVDIASSNGIDIDNYFADLKRDCQKSLNEKEIWVTYGLVVRVI